MFEVRTYRPSLRQMLLNHVPGNIDNQCVFPLYPSDTNEENTATSSWHSEIQLAYEKTVWKTSRMRKKIMFPAIQMLAIQLKSNGQKDNGQRLSEASGNNIKGIQRKNKGLNILNASFGGNAPHMPQAISY